MNLHDPELYLDAGYARSYGSEENNFWSDLCKELVEEAELKPGDIVADLGCGTGYATREIVKSGVARVYAIEPSRAMLEEANGNLADSIVIEGTIDELISSGLQKPNVILSSGVFVVMRDSLSTLRKIYDYLENNGRYIFTVEDWSNANVNGEPLDSFFERVRGYEQKIGIENDDLFIKGSRRYSPGEVQGMVAEANGRVTKSYSREMSHLVENGFDHGYKLASVNLDIGKLEGRLREEGMRLGTWRILKLGEELDNLRERKRLFEEFKSLYGGKIFVVGEQHVFHTAKI